MFIMGQKHNRAARQGSSACPALARSAGGMKKGIGIIPLQFESRELCHGFLAAIRRHPIASLTITPIGALT
jgi:hypothetical protein